MLASLFIHTNTSYLRFLSCDRSKAVFITTVFDLFARKHLIFDTSVEKGKSAVLESERRVKSAGGWQTAGCWTADQSNKNW